MEIYIEIFREKVKVKFPHKMYKIGEKVYERG